MLPTDTGARTISALVVMPDGALVAGGYAVTPGAGAYIARWDGTTWSALGTGVNAWVRSLAVQPSGDLVALGLFTSAGGAPNTTYIARWNGTSWSAVGTGLQFSEDILGLMPNGDLLRGVGPSRWTGSNWVTLGAGVPNIRALCSLPNGDVLGGGYLGGTFTGVARWIGSTWSALGWGVNGSVYAVAGLPNGGAVVGGARKSAGGEAFDPLG